MKLMYVQMMLIREEDCKTIIFAFALSFTIGIAIAISRPYLNFNSVFVVARKYVAEGGLIR